MHRVSFSPAHSGSQIPKVSVAALLFGMAVGALAHLRGRTISPVFDPPCPCHESCGPPALYCYIATLIPVPVVPSTSVSNTLSHLPAYAISYLRASPLYVSSIDPLYILLAFPHERETSDRLRAAAERRRTGLQTCLFDTPFTPGINWDSMWCTMRRTVPRLWQYFRKLG